MVASTEPDQNVLAQGLTITSIAEIIRGMKSTRILKKANLGSVWQLQDAKTHFSALVEAASCGTPQQVTRHGKNSVVVVSIADFEALHRAAAIDAPSLAKNLLAMPRAVESKSKRPEIRLRDIDF